MVEMRDESNDRSVENYLRVNRYPAACTFVGLCHQGVFCPLGAHRPFLSSIVECKVMYLADEQRTTQEIIGYPDVEEDYEETGQNYQCNR